MRYIKEFNSKQKSFAVGLNSLAILTPSEYQSMLGANGVKKPRNLVKFQKKGDTPESRDWRESGVVQVVKDQGICGAAWAFATIGASESAYAIATGKLQYLSEQNLIDCVTDCSGCNGGLPSEAYDYVMTKQGGSFNLATDYPYTGVVGSCKYDESKATGTIKGYTEVSPYGIEDELMDAVGTTGPVSCLMDASATSFQLYTGGIYDEPRCSSWQLDHCVVCIGYGTEAGVDYWIVKNNWGTAWGEDGYIRMIRNKDNQCGLASDAFIPWA